MDEFNMLGQNEYHFQWAFNLNQISQLSMANNKQMPSALVSRGGKTVITKIKKSLKNNIPFGLNGER